MFTPTPGYVSRTPSGLGMQDEVANEYRDLYHPPGMADYSSRGGPSVVPAARMLESRPGVGPGPVSMRDWYDFVKRTGYVSPIHTIQHSTFSDYSPLLMAAGPFLAAAGVIGAGVGAGASVASPATEGAVVAAGLEAPVAAAAPSFWLSPTGVFLEKAGAAVVTGVAAGVVGGASRAIVNAIAPSAPVPTPSNLAGDGMADYSGILNALGLSGSASTPSSLVGDGMADSGAPVNPAVLIGVAVAVLGLIALVVLH